MAPNAPVHTGSNALADSSNTVTTYCPLKVMYYPECYGARGLVVTHSRIANYNACKACNICINQNFNVFGGNTSVQEFMTKEGTKTDSGTNLMASSTPAQMASVLFSESVFFP